MRQQSCALRLVATVGCLATLLSACSDDGDDQAANDTRSAAAGQPSTAPAPERDDGATPSASPAPGVEQSEPVVGESPTAQPLASVAVPIGFIDGGELEMAVSTV
jgi:hypothetical protein